MSTLEQLYQANITLLHEAGVPFQQWQHEPILDFATDEKVAQELGWTGTHTKSLFLKLKGGGYALLFTEKDARLNAKAIKALIGQRPSICEDDEMTAVTTCVPGAVGPFVLPKDIPVIVDPALFQKTELLYTPGHPHLTLGFAGTDLDKLLARLHNPILMLT
ncbi:YbaK/EbsC family protein [Vibrio fluvialis]|nr:YbaK/EbsC family protein [Vibrio fluvialis]MCG6400020.1 YbaK/EbsC family protein [Vibrio fluvialis]